MAVQRHSKASGTKKRRASSIGKRRRDVPKLKRS